MLSDLIKQSANGYRPLSVMNVGVIGCGNISSAYLQLAEKFSGYRITSCADLKPEVAQAQAEEYSCQAQTIESLLADPQIGLILNLTVPAAHFEVSSKILNAGKHVYSEKPYVLELSEGEALQSLAARHNLRIGSAPDTFLGGSHQAARQCVDSGKVGHIIGGSCYFQSHGMEDWHPDPDFFFQAGGGPILDMGAYYVSNLVQLIGPVKRVVAMANKPFTTRTIGSERRAGETIEVEVDTSVRAILEFQSGAQISFAASWDVWAHEHNCMELYGSEGTLYVPDPNGFGEDVRYTDGETETQVAPLEVVSKPNYVDSRGISVANYRGIGLADMVAAIHEDRPHRCDGALALHVIETLTAILRSAESGQFVSLKTSCEIPAPLDDEAARRLMA